MPNAHESGIGDEHRFVQPRATAEAAKDAAVVQHPLDLTKHAMKRIQLVVKGLFEEDFEFPYQRHTYASSSPDTYIIAIHSGYGRSQIV
jgi:hypothetical protein